MHAFNGCVHSILIMVHWWCCGWALEAQLHGSQRMGAPREFEVLVSERVLADPLGCTACITDRTHTHFDTHRRFCHDDCLTDCELDAFADASACSLLQYSLLPWHISP